MWSAASFAGSTSTWICWSRWPKIATLATLRTPDSGGLTTHLIVRGGTESAPTAHTPITPSDPAPVSTGPRLELGDERRAGLGGRNDERSGDRASSIMPGRDDAVRLPYRGVAPLDRGAVGRLPPAPALVRANRHTNQPGATGMWPRPRTRPRPRWGPRACRGAGIAVAGDEPREAAEAERPDGENEEAADEQQQPCRPTGRAAEDRCQHAQCHPAISVATSSEGRRTATAASATPVLNSARPS
jgi:hypothetical protein